jgi:hypothetical protein
MPFTDWGDPFDPRTRPFNHILYGREGVVANTEPGNRSMFKVFQCPGEEYGWQIWPNFYEPEEEGEKSYFTANGTAFRLNNMTFSVGGELLVIGIYGRSLTHVPDTGRTVAFMEARAFQTIWTNDVWGELPHGELTGYHKKLGYFVLAYADGHASFEDMGAGTFYERSEKYDYSDIRGTWGQLDCFPSPPLPEP